MTQSLQKAGGRPLLTTGAALAGEADAETEVNLPLGFATGMRVRHPRYGIGIVVETGGYSRHRTVTVEFVDDQRRESFILSKCPLQPVG